MVSSSFGMFVADRLYAIAGRYIELYPRLVSFLVIFLLCLISHAILLLFVVILASSALKQPEGVIITPNVLWAVLGFGCLIVAGCCGGQFNGWLCFILISVCPWLFWICGCPVLVNSHLMA